MFPMILNFVPDFFLVVRQYIAQPKTFSPSRLNFNLLTPLARLCPGIPNGYVAARLRLKCKRSTALPKTERQFSFRSLAPLQGKTRRIACTFGLRLNCVGHGLWWRWESGSITQIPKKPLGEPSRSPTLSPQLRASTNVHADPTKSL